MNSRIDSSKMDNYLDQQSAEGEISGEAEFTISAEASLRKMAHFQLPFEGAWLLKVVQAIVATGAENSIDIKLSKQHIDIHFTMPLSWTRESVSKAFISPSVNSDTSLQHLVTGLRPVALKDKRSFSLNWFNGERLHWNGQSLHQEKGHGVATLRVAQPRPRGGLLSFVRFTSRQNAALTKVLSERAFTCPLTLKLDGRVLNSLAACPLHGISNTSRPVALLLPQTELQAWTPPTNFSQVVREQRTYEFPGLNTYLEQRRVIWGNLSKPSVLGLVCAHIEIHHGESTGHFIESQTSICYWVEDGVVIQTQELNRGKHPLSVGLFLSASGLPKDLSTFSLLDSEQKEQALKTAMKAIGEDLKKLSLDALPPYFENEDPGNTEALVAALGMTFMGVCTLGLKLMVLPAAALGSAMVFLGSKDEQKKSRNKVEQLQSGLESLRKDWQKNS